MKFISVEQAIKKKRGTVSVRGWIYRIRKLKDNIFIVLRDSSEIIQCVVKNPKLVKIADKLLMESSLEIEGRIYADKRAPTGYEVEVKKLKVVSEAEDFPIGKDQSTEFLADKRHLWLRSRKMIAVMKVRHTVFGAIHEYFRGKGFYEYQSPIFQAMQCEGGSTLFEVPYFGKRVYLAQTWQLFAEPAIQALEKIYTMAPSFRAERSKTSRHLTEYWHAEMEIGWNSFKELQDYAEDLIKFIVKKALKENKKELKILGRDLKKLEPIVKKPFVRMTYDQVLKLLQKKAKMKVKWGKDLRTIEEDKLSDLHNVPVIVTHYPKGVKAFYMKEDPKNPKVVEGFDVIGPERYGELIGASQREESIDKLKANLKAIGEDPKKYEFYFDSRRYGGIPHAGFGMGVERVIAWICGLENIKDAVPFPRTMVRYTP